MISSLSILSMILCLYGFFWIQEQYRDGHYPSSLDDYKISLWSEHLDLQTGPDLHDIEDLDDESDDEDDLPVKPKDEKNQTHEEKPKVDPEPKKKNHTDPTPPPNYGGSVKKIKCEGDCSLIDRGIQILTFRRKSREEIYRTDAFLERGAIVPNKDIQDTIMCKLRRGYFQYCMERYISEVVDLAYSFQPVYSTRQAEQPMMYHHHKNFKYLMQSYGFPVITIEGIYKDLGQRYMVTNPGNEPHEIQITLYDKIFMRENLLNVAARKVKGWEYLLWIDSHQVFLNRYWWEDAIYKMEHYNSVQFFQTLAHQLQDQNITDWRLDFPGSLYIWTHTRPLEAHRDRLHLWIGNAFGIRRELYEQIDFIMDYCISGCCDCAYNMASMHDWNEWNIFSTWPRYVDVFRPWVDKTRKIFQAKTTVVRGHMLHLWHERFFHFEEMLRAVSFTPFDPNNDIKRDENFTLYLTNPYWKSLFATNG